MRWRRRFKASTPNAPLPHKILYINIDGLTEVPQMDFPPQHVA